MPEGLPSAAELMEQEVQFFSIDTDRFRAAGFKFDEGALNQLQHQIPVWMSLQLSEVVRREILNQRMEPVAEAMHQFDAALKKISRAASIDVSRVSEVYRGLDVADAATGIFETQLQTFLTRLRGAILPLSGPNVMEQMFERYFATRPPFEQRKEKRAEFPDAAALLAIEAFALNNDCLGIVISDDGGWANYAATSSRLYCVKTIDAFTALFASAGANADAVRAKVRAALEDASSPLSAQLRIALDYHVRNSQWDVGDLYSGGSYRLEAEVYEAVLASFELDLSEIEIWFVDHDPSMCVVEFTASVVAGVSVSVESYAYDSIDREEIMVSSDSADLTSQIEVPVFLTCSGDLLSSPASAWQAEFDVAEASYGVDVGEFNPDFGEPD